MIQVAMSPQALWFEDAGLPLFAWHHPAHAPKRGTGIVLCPPFAHEYMVSYRAYVKLARRLAEAGFPVLFFDYASTGDSCDVAEISLAVWQQNISAAMEKLRRLAEVHDVALVGLRLGALLAARVAATEPVAALVLIAPVVSGRQFVREMQIYRSMSPIPPSENPVHRVSEEELTGYSFPQAMQQELAAIELHALPRLHTPACLLLTKDVPTAAEKKLHARLENLEVVTQMTQAAGYAQMMSDDAYDSIPPQAMWQEVETWLVQHCPLHPHAVHTSQLEQKITIAHRGQQLKEEVIGTDGLFGILTQPAENTPLSARPAVVLTNIGANHHVGNHRIYVSLARTLAARGLSVIRFDRAGFGYSRVTRAGQEHEVYAEEGADDVHRIMDALQERGIAQQFVLAGLCSGAYFSYHAAQDARVVGLTLINQLTFQWHDGDSLDVRVAQTFKSTDFYMNRIVSLQTWRRLVSGNINFRGIAKTLLQRIGHRLRILIVQHASRLPGMEHWLSDVAQNFLQMKRRGIDLFFVFAAEDSSIDLMIQHLGTDARVLGHYPRLRCEIISDSDHTFTPRWAQTYLCERLAEHLEQRFG